MQLDPKHNNSIIKTNKLHRITAVWGFSEAAFGGVLHALHIPLTGLFLGGTAIIFISLIAHLSDNKKEILKSTITVIIIKALISPYTPPTAYFAVALQGLLGYLIFSFFKIRKVAVFLFAIIFMLYSSFQKLIILTIVFGVNLWNSIDEFTIYVLSQFNIDRDILPVNFSIIIISLYCGLHLIGAIFFSIMSIKAPKWLERQHYDVNEHQKKIANEIDLFNQTKRTRKKWWKRPSGFLLIFLFSIILIFSYTSPQYFKIAPVAILVMILRAVVITFLWFTFISPFLIKMLNKIIEKKKFEMASEINSITNLFPDFKVILNYCWKINSNLTGIRRLKKFFSCSLSILLTTDYKSNG